MRRTAVPLLVVAGLMLAACGGSSSASSTTSASSTSSSDSSSSVSSTPASAHLAKTKFVLHAGLAFGVFHRWIYKPFKAGDFNHPLSHKATVTKAIAAAAFVIHEVKLAKQAAAGSKALSKVVAPLTAIASTLAVVRTNLTSRSANVAPVNAAAIDFANSKISTVDAEARAAGQPITETTAGAKF